MVENPLRDPLPPAEALSAAAWRDLALVLQARVVVLEEKVAELMARLGQDSSNSSKPPSTDPPGRNRYPPRQRGQKKRGAQPGHKGVRRDLVPPEAVSEFRPCFPEQCRGCRGAFLGETPSMAPLRWQVVELPPMTPFVIEYQLHRLVCPGCRAVTTADLPPEARYGTGPRLTGLIALLCGRFRVSREETALLLEMVLGIPLCKGTVQACCERTSNALAGTVSEMEATLSQAPAVHLDETGWREGKARRWLWVAITSRLAVFALHEKRGMGQLRAWFQRGLAGTAISDRWSAYLLFPPEKRQLCWAHLKRDLQAIVDRGGPGKDPALAAHALRKAIFRLWHRFKQGALSRAQLLEQTAPFRAAFEDFCKNGRDQTTDPKWRTLGTDLLALWPAVFRFLEVDGVEPTNNHAERGLRPGVLWRKVSQGTRSNAGSRFVARILSVATTCRLQAQPLLEFLHRAILAHLRGEPGPSLLPAGA
jgi:transposase